MANPTRTTSVATGTLLILATVAAVAAAALDPTRTETLLLAAPGQPHRLALAAIFYLLAAAGSASIPIALYPLLQKIDAPFALASVVFRPPYSPTGTASMRRRRPPPLEPPAWVRIFDPADWDDSHTDHDAEIIAATTGRWHYTHDDAEVWWWASQCTNARNTAGRPPPTTGPTRTTSTRPRGCTGNCPGRSDPKKTGPDNPGKTRATPVKLFTRWLEGVHGLPGIHVLADTYHLAIPYFPDDGRWHVEGTSVALDGAVVVQLGDRYASARVHLFDVESEAVEPLRHRGHGAVQPLLPAPVLPRDDWVVLRGVPLDLVVRAGHERLHVAR
jgi:hypothetical protein